jgi:hypothetical protein
MSHKKERKIELNRVHHLKYSVPTCSKVIPYSLGKHFFVFLAFVVSSFCTSKQSFGYLVINLARCVFVEVFVCDCPKTKIWLESFWRLQIFQNMKSVGRFKSDLRKLCNAAGVV